MDIGTRIKELREKSGISLRQLAVQAGMAPSTLHDIETPGSNPTFEKIAAICSALNISLVDFFSGYDIELLHPEIYELLKLARELSPRQLEVIKSVAKELKDSSPKNTTT